MRSHLRVLIFAMTAVALLLALSYLTDAGRSASKALIDSSAAEVGTSSDQAQIIISTTGFIPSVITATVGSPVSWYNAIDATVSVQSGSSYRVYLPLVMRSGSGFAQVTVDQPQIPTEFALAASEAFSSTILPGGIFSHTFLTPGKHPYYLVNDPHFAGQVIVTASPSDFVLNASPISSIIQQGQLTTYTVSVTGTLGVAPVSFTVGGLPSGAAALFAPNPLVPTSTAILTVSTALSSPIGNYAVVVTGTDGSAVHSTSVTLTLTPHADFDLSVTPKIRGVALGGKVTYSVQMHSLYGFAAPVDLSVNGLPSGTQATWSANPVTPTAATVLTLSSAVTTTLGDHSLVIVGVGGGFTHTSPVTLSVISNARPDLLIVTLTTEPITPVIRYPAAVTAAVYNGGDADAGPFKVDWYVNPVSPPISTTLGTGTSFVAGLAAGDAITLTGVYTFSSEGQHTLWAQADRDNAVIESNENNNRIGPVARTVVSNIVNVCGTVSSNTVWQTGHVYVVSCDVSVNAGVTLTVQAGTIVKLNQTGIVVGGTLLAQGTSTNPVVFTSWKDDSVGGNTNGDGNATSPAPGDWGQILVSDGRLDLAYTRVQYGGYYPCGGGPVQGVIANLSFCSYNYHNAEIHIANSTIFSNSLAGIAVGSYNGGESYSLSILGSVLRGNAGYGVYNGGVSTSVDARYNYWGSNNGPTPHGSGDAINTYQEWNSVCQCYITRPAVIFSPWLNAAGQVVGPSPAQSSAAPSSPATGWAAKPVNVVFGNYTYQYTDLSIPARGEDFVFRRTYNSANTIAGPLGIGWTHSYNVTATRTSTTTAIVQREDGRQDLYINSGNGIYLPPSGIHDSLAWVTDHFVLTRTDQVVYSFNLSGYLAKIADRNGNTITLTYSSGRLSTLTDPAGRQITFAYTGGLLTQMRDPVSRTVGLGYTAGRLTSVTDVNGKATSYAYDGSGRLQSIIDANGHTFVNNTYDAQGRVIQQRDALNDLTTFSYYTTTQQTVVVDPRINPITYTYDSAYRTTGMTDPFGNTESYTYDADDNRTSVADKRGNTTTYIYDGQGNVLTIVDPQGCLTCYTYDTRNNLSSETNARGKTTTYQYDAHSNLTHRIDALTKDMAWTYDAYGQILSKTDARRNTTRYGYDLFGNQTVITDALSNVTTITFDLVGRKLSERNPLTYTTGYAYDAANHMTVITDALSSTTVYTYDAVGNRIAAQDALGRVTRYGYDAKDRLAVVTDTLGDTTRYIYDTNNNQTAAIDPLGRKTSYAYDALNRLVSTTDPLNKTTTYQYDANGNPTQIVDANNRSTSYTYDALNRLTGVTDAAGGVVTYTYDAVGNRIGLLDANRHATTYAYDALNRLVSTTDPLSNTTTYGYDAASNRIRATQPNGTIIIYTYDALNRLAGTTAPGLGITYTYNAVGNRSRMTDTTGSTAYVYDPLNRLTQVTDPNGRTVSFGYDAVGNRTRLTYPSGQIVAYTYDAVNRMDNVIDWTNRIVTYTYDAAGQLLSTALPNSTTTNYAYDPAGHVTAITHTSAISGSFAFFRYTYDNVGNRLSEISSDGTSSYTCNVLDRLTDVTYPNGEHVTYQYDPMGNRLAMTSTVSGAITYSYDTADRLLRAGSDTFGWDVNGRQITRTYEGATASYTFDSLDRLTQVITGANTIAFNYNGDGVRVRKTVNGTATNYVQDIAAPLPVVLVERTRGQDTSYLYGLDLLEQVSPGDSRSYYYTDALGSTRALSNDTGQWMDTYTYDVFGSVRARTGNGSQTFTFTGEQFDDEVGLIYLRSRFYNAHFGRFITRDRFRASVRIPQSLNRYIYLTNNPVNNADPSGMGLREDIQETALDVIELAADIGTHLVRGAKDTLEGISTVIEGIQLPLDVDKVNKTGDEYRRLEAECAMGDTCDRQRVLEARRRYSE